MGKSALFAVLLVSLALFLGAAYALDDSGWDSDSWNGGSGDLPVQASAGCCCGPTFIMVLGAAAFTYAYGKE